MSAGQDRAPFPPDGLDAFVPGVARGKRKGNPPTP